MGGWRAEVREGRKGIPGRLGYPSMVIVVANRIPIATGWEEEFERRWRNRTWSIARLPGFLGTEVLRPVKGGPYVVATHWRSMEDFERWTESDAFKEAHGSAPPKEAFSGPNVLEIHEVIAERLPDA